MSKKTTESVEEKEVKNIKPIPENLPEELLPLYDWWREKGVKSVSAALAIALAAAGIMGYMHLRKNRIADANIELTQANSVEELEGVVAEYGNTKAGNAARIRLAKAYYDASKYENALASYEECENNGVPKGFEDVVTLGRAHALEALEKTEQAFAVYKSFTESRKESYLYPQAAMGLARVTTLQGDKDAAKKILEELKAKKTDETAWEMAIANLEEIIDRYEPRRKRSLFEMADEAGKVLDTEAQSTPATEVK